MKEEYLSHIVMSKINNVCYISDVETYDLLYVNEAFKKLLGENGENYYGRKCYEVLAGLDEPCHFCKNKYLEKDKIYKCENRNPMIGIIFEWEESLIEIDGRVVKIEIGVDIERTKKKLLKSEKKSSFEETLLNCVHTLSEHKDMEVAINGLLETLGEYYLSDYAFIFESSQDSLSISNTYEWHSANVESQMQKVQNLPFEYFGSWVEALLKEEVIQFELSKQDKDFIVKYYDNLELQQIDRAMVSALKFNQEIIGFFGVTNPKNNYHDTLLLGSLSLFLANALDRKNILNEFKRLASLDIFTGLYNRNKYIETIEEIFSKKSDAVGIVFLDINGMKKINDEYGHENGDELILLVVKLLKKSFPKNLFRIGGDEFVVLEIGNDRDLFNEKVLNLRKAISEEVEGSVSLGSTWCVNAEDISQQIAHANELMYVDKQNYYKDGKVNRKNYRANAAVLLQKAIKEDDFIVFLQPQILLADGKVVGAEALVRKKDGKGGLIFPDKFIFTYESDGIIPYLDFSVLEIVCKTLKEWRELGYPLIPISVNFSRLTILEYKVGEKINNICKKYDVDPKYITIELTEHISNISLENLNEILTKIASFGFAISLDDFGREYSNLAALINIEFNEIKLDKTLIDDITLNTANRTLILHIVGMCNAFRNTTMVAEGIETYEQSVLLRELDCDLKVGQGFYYSKPLPIDKFLEYYLKH